MDVIGNCRVTRAREKLIEIIRNDSFTLICFEFCHGIQFLVQSESNSINSMAASVYSGIVQSRNLFTQDK